MSTDEAERIVLDIAGKLGLDGPVSEVLGELRALSIPDTAEPARSLVFDVAARLVEAVGGLDRSDFLFAAVRAATRILADFVTQAGQLSGPSTRSR
ncbi:hypothetical protein [Prauserella flavalba]|uniref:hypothetical protein n=1 Tax=Prauserella flavalba TaxID=1477506 RepID=UPI0011B69462|nr:hypothetical protein [Prauserella flavalba]